MTNIETDSKIKLDGTDISEIIKGKSTTHAPIFTMKDTTIRTIRDGKWKLFVKKPDYYKEVDLTNWKDERGPDGTTIIAPMAQATPANYPGLKPEKMEGEMLLFNLDDDPTESKNLVESFPKIKEKLIKEYTNFLKSLPK